MNTIEYLVQYTENQWALWAFLGSKSYYELFEKFTLREISRVKNEKIDFSQNDPRIYSINFKISETGKNQSK